MKIILGTANFGHEYGFRKVKAENPTEAQGLLSQKLDSLLKDAKIDGELIFLDIALKERPRLSRFSFAGIKKSEADDLRERIKLVSGKVLNENLVNNTRNSIQKY